MNSFAFSPFRVFVILCACAAVASADTVVVDDAPWQVEPRAVTALCPPVRPSPYPYPTRPQQPGPTFGTGTASQQPSLPLPSGTGVKPPAASTGTEVAAAKQPGTIVLVVVSAKFGTSDSATGWVLGKHVITCAHVFRDRVRDQVAITLANGYVVGGKLLALDAVGDVAVIEPSQQPPETLVLASAEPQKGQKLQLCGLHGGYHAQAGLALGFASSTPNGPQDVLVMSGQVASGDSGGPIYNADGDVVGLITGGKDGKVYGPRLSVLQALLATLPGSNPQPPIPNPSAPEAPTGQAEAAAGQAGPTTPTAPDLGQVLLRVDGLQQQVSGVLGQLPQLRAQIAQSPTVIQAAKQAEAIAGKLIEQKLASPAASTGLTALLISLGLPTGIAGGVAAITLLLVRRMLRKAIQAGASTNAGAGAASSSAAVPGQPSAGSVTVPLSYLQWLANFLRPPAAKPTSQAASPSTSTPQATTTATADGAVEDLPHLPVDYARIWAEHAQACGESLAARAKQFGLYKEAYGGLRSGSIPIKSANPVAIADKADAWVAARFYEKGAQRAEPDNVFHNALLGFLYQDATARLASGDIAVEGGPAAAEAIEQWVQREFLRRQS